MSTLSVSVTEVYKAGQHSVNPPLVMRRQFGHKSAGHVGILAVSAWFGANKRDLSLNGSRS
jgi:hypothetical protein